MITFLKGRLVEKYPTHVVLDCNGVGYHLNISLNTYSQLGDSEACLLHTHLAIREDAHTLYGFVDKSEREIFLLLLSVSGIGPSSARMVLSTMNPEEIRQALLQGDVEAFKKVKGIGAKSAQRIIVDLRDKVDKEGLGDVNIPSLGDNTVKDEALSALVALGFSKNMAEKAISKTLKQNQNKFEVEELIKESLKNF